MLSDDQWIEIAETCVHLDFNSKKPDGYVNAIRSVGELAAAKVLEKQAAQPVVCASKTAESDAQSSLSTKDEPQAQPVEPVGTVVLFGNDAAELERLRHAVDAFTHPGESDSPIATASRILNAKLISERNVLRDENIELRAAVGVALKALESNDQWHKDYDDHDGYPESELAETNASAIATLKEVLP